METIRQYTPEQEDKLAALREAGEAERRQKAFKRIENERDNKWREDWTPKVGSKVRVMKDSVTIIGHVLDVKDNLFTVSTPHGILKKVKRTELQVRLAIDYSQVVIPEALKAYSTQSLVNYIQDYTRQYHDDN